MSRECEILKAASTIAVLGMSPKPHRTSHAIALAMRAHNYRIIPVNPGHERILDLECFPNLAALEEPVEIVNVFRSASHQHDVARDVLAMKHKPLAVWFQLNAGGDDVQQEIEAAGIACFVDS
ncbi:MAG: CoA-binding protein [Nitrospira sp.]|nr:CoA-binding protein [Nitrospira sp.]